MVTRINLLHLVGSLKYKWVPLFYNIHIVLEIKYYASVVFSKKSYGRTGNDQYPTENSNLT